MPVRSPGPIRHSISRSTGRPSNETDTSSRSMTSFPSRAVASLASSTVLRSGGTSAMSWLAASIRNLGFEVRAGGPRRNQASSLRIRFCRLASAAAASRSRSTRCSTYAAYPPSNGSTIPSCTSHVVVATSSRNQRSCVTSSSPPVLRAQRCFRWSASQVMPSMSRWLVGSSRAITSHSPTSNLASCTRRRWPPLRVATVASQAMSDTSPPTTSRTRALPAHWCSAWSPTSVQPTVCCGSRVSAWLRAATLKPPRWVTRPVSGRSWPVSRPSRLDLPSPFRPTMPMRAPSLTPSVTDSNTTWVGYSRWMASAPSRCTTGPTLARYV